MMESVSRHSAQREIRSHQTIALQLALVDGEGFGQSAELTNLAKETGRQESKNHNEGCGGWKFCVEKL